MDKLVIFWTQTAKQQRDYVFDYWNKRNKSTTYTKKLILLIRDRTELLKSHPNMGRKTEFKKTRTIAMGHYSIFYQVYNSKIVITGFWDNRQDPEKLLKFLTQK